MPERTTTQSRTKGPGKTNNPAGGSTRPTDRRTGAGVGRLSDTTSKVSLKDSKRTPSKQSSTMKRQARSAGNESKRGSGTGTRPASSRRPATKQKAGGDEMKPEQDEDDDEEIIAVETVDPDPDECKENEEETESKSQAQNDEQQSEEHDQAEVSQSWSGDQQQQQQEIIPEKKEFDIRLFTITVRNLADKFTEDKYTRVGDDYPVDDLVLLIAEVNSSVEKYKQHTLQCQEQLELLRDRMVIVRDNIHDSVQTRTFEARQEHEPTLEQKELAAKLAKINAEVAHANIELARLVKISAETESVAMEAAQSSAQAQEEAEQAKAETEWRERKAKEREEEEARRSSEEEKRRIEEEKREEEKRKKQEQDWKRREAAGHEGDTTPSWEEWDPYVYEITDEHGDPTVGCIIRGDPTRFNARHVTCEPVIQLESTFTFEENEELVSPIMKLEPSNNEEYLSSSLFVAVPFFATRSSMLSREPVIKAKVDGVWKDLVTREVSFEDHKDYRFAQAEVTNYTSVAVVTRFKRDYVTLTRKTSKIVFSADHRITLSTSRGSFDHKELFMLQVQPVDSNTVNDLKNRDLSMRGLLNSSPIVTTKWERLNFKNTVTITTPCPPNPAKAKKLAAMRAAKEAKMNQPMRRIPDPIDVQEKKEKKKQNRKPNEPEEEAPIKRQEQRWYMGIYGGSDDDENDNLYLMQRFASGRWTVVPDVTFKQVKLDLLQFELEQPVERFMILRTRTNVDEESAQSMAVTLESALARRQVQVVLRQRLEDPLDTVVQVVPISRAEKVLKQLQEEGFEEGPKTCPDVSVCEGDIIEIGFRGNLRNSGDEMLQVPFNSNMTTSIEFSLQEVDKYLQRNFSVFRGFVQFYRKYPIIKKSGQRAKQQQQKTDEDEAAQEPEPVQYERELLTEILVNIPKYHIESAPSSPRKQAACAVRVAGPVNEDTLRQLAMDLGDEWYRLAHHLDVSHSRVQAIIRNTQAQEETEDVAKYEMMMTWLKRAPKASNKVDALSVALAKTGRDDLAEELRRRYMKPRGGRRSIQMAA